MAEIICAGDGGVFKTCTRCSGTQPLSAFSKMKNSASGSRAACKRCCSAAELERNKSKGIRTLDQPFPCSDCGVLIARKSGFQRYCQSCAEAAATESNRARNQKYESKRTRPRTRCPDERKRAYEKFRQKHPNAARLSAAKYNEKNRAKINQKSRDRAKTKARRDWLRAWDAERRKMPSVRLDQRMKTAIGHALRGGKSGRGWEALVGYSLDDLSRHLERQFLPGMSWENIGEWHVDHIVPRAAFNYQTDDDPDFRACWTLTNLRPLWARDNISKGKKVLTFL